MERGTICVVLRFSDWEVAEMEQSSFTLGLRMGMLCLWPAMEKGRQVQNLRAHDHAAQLHMNNKGEVLWDIPVSGIPTVEEREIWDRHPKFISLQRSRDGWGMVYIKSGTIIAILSGY